MEDLKVKLSNYYCEYTKLQHLDANNEEFKELILKNFEDLIVPNIRAIVEILEDCVNEELQKSNYDLSIVNWLQRVFNLSVYQLSLRVMKEHFDELTDDDKLLHYFVVKVEFIKIKVFKELQQHYSDEIKQSLNDLINISKNIINTFQKDLMLNHNEFTTSIELVDKIFSQLEK